MPGYAVGCRWPGATGRSSSTPSLSAGQPVTRGEPLLWIEAMKMEHPVTASRGRRGGRRGGSRRRSGFGRRSAGTAGPRTDRADLSGTDVSRTDVGRTSPNRRAWTRPILGLDEDHPSGTEAREQVVSLPLIREPQQDRSRITRRRLLDAAVASLAQVGWTATSVAMVAGRAGVSRGAAQHHFPTRESLFEAVIDHISEQRMAELARGADELPTGRRADRGGAGTAGGQLHRAVVRGRVADLDRGLVRGFPAGPDHSARGRARPAVARDRGRTARRRRIPSPAQGRSCRAAWTWPVDSGLADVLRDDSRRRRRVIAQWAVVLDQVLTE